MTSHNDILIIGGGVIGLTTAYRLAEQGVSVTVIDHQQTGREASWAGAGMLPPGNLRFANSPEARLRAYSHQLWGELSSDLKARSGIDNEYRRCGAIEVCEPSNAAVFHTQIAQWKTEALEIETLDRDAIERHVPGLHSRFQSGVGLTDFSQVRNPRHLKALATACLSMGVEIVEDVEHVRLSVSPHVSTKIVASTASRSFHVDRICVAAGSWTSSILESVGIKVPVNPVRGQMVQLRMPKLPFTRVIELGRRYLVPRADGLILVGSTEEHTGYEKRNTSEGVSGLLQFAESIVPELASAEITRCWAGLRPASPDELPFLGRVPGFDNLFVAAGHFRSGLQMSPATGSVMAYLLLDREPQIDLSGLTMERSVTAL